MWLSLLFFEIENLSVVCVVTVHLHPDCVSDPGDAGRSIGSGVPQPGEWPESELLTDMNETLVSSPESFCVTESQFHLHSSNTVCTVYIFRTRMNEIPLLLKITIQWNIAAARAQHTAA